MTPVLVSADYLKPFWLHTDASELCSGTVLYQGQDDGIDLIVAFTSHTLRGS